MRKSWIATAGAAGLLALAGCGGGGSYGSSGGSSAGHSPAGTAAAAATALSTWTSPVGQIVVTGSGRAVYVFDKDAAGSGTSACTGTCASLWPAVTTTAAAPVVRGVTGTLGTIARPDGSRQVTLDGHPLYTYSGDSGSGKIGGQGFMNLWWVVSPGGTKVTTAPSAPSSSSPGGGGYTY